MVIGHALLVAADPVTIGKFSLGLEELSLSPEVCPGILASIQVLNRRKFEAVIVDLQLGERCGLLLDEVHRSPSNRRAVTFAINDGDLNTAASFLRRTNFVFEQPVSMQSIRKILKPAYEMILRERRRYFRCPISVPVVILRRAKPEVRCTTVNISEGGMALRTCVLFSPGESVHVEFALPGRDVPFSAESTICWCKTDRLGIRFVSVSQEQKSELQGWLSRKLEGMLPELVAGEFRQAEGSSMPNSGEGKRAWLHPAEPIRSS